MSEDINDGRPDRLAEHRQHHYKNSLGCVVSLVWRTYHARANVVLDELGLYKGQEMILYTLFYRGGITQTELADFLHVKPATITNTLQRMEKAGWVERRPDEIDQRVTRVSLSEAGRNLIVHLDETWLGLEESAFGVLDEDERNQLHGLLMKIYENLKEPT